MGSLRLNDLGIFKDMKQNPQCEMLVGYLSAMETNMDEFLQRIQINYSTYTDHSIQHSMRILEYLELLLGENINILSINEKFCLMAAAMMHDSGMAVDGLCGNGDGRVSHGDRSAKVVTDYFLDKNPSLAERNRIYEPIAFACRAHCMDREELCKDKLFERTNQISGSGIRYKLIATLLRIGDLLDMAESRTNEYVLRVFRERYAEENMLHHLKCFDVKVFNVTPDVIEVCIAVKKIEEYDISASWLQMLRDEVDFANKHLRNEGFSFPEPKTSVENESGKRISAEKVRFEIDDRGTIWNVISRSIYTDKMDFLRELIQNAIDATLARAYHDENIRIDYPSPRGWGPGNCKDIVVAYSEKEKKLYVCDRGIGMDNRDLSRFLFRVTGTGYKTMNHRGFQFPAIAKFGIGFVSCLVHASFIRIYTKKVGSNETNIVFLNGDSNLALVQADNSIKMDGTTIVLALKDRLSSTQIETSISETFQYPSVGIMYVDLDRMERTANLMHISHGIGELQKEPYRVGEICTQIQTSQTMKVEPLIRLFDQWDQAETIMDQIITCLKYGDLHERYSLVNNGYNSFLQDITRLSMILSSLQIGEDLPLDIGKITNREFYSQMTDYQYQLEPLYERLKEEKAKANAELNKYASSFHVHIRSDQSVSIGVDWNYFVIEMNESLCVQNAYRAKEPVDLKNKRGILFVRTNKQDYQAGVEYDAVAGFCFCDNEIFDALIHPESQYTGGTVFGIQGKEADILHEWSLWCSGDKYWDEDSQIWAGNDYNLRINLLQIDSNRIYEMVDDNVEKVERFLSSDKNIRKLEYIVIMPDHLQFDDESSMVIVDYDRIIGSHASRYSQDGIMLRLDLEAMFPVGLFRICCNCVGDARLPLNVTRHKISELNDDILNWIQKTGIPMQKEIVHSVRKAIADCGLQCELNKLQIRPALKDNLLARHLYDTFTRTAR